MWSLIPADLFQLKGGGGERFVHFVDRLIRAEAACAGLAQAEIETQLRVNIKDGGVDTEVRQAIPCSKTGWFEVPTCWQFKAMDAKDIEKNDLQSEIKKPYAKKLIQMGYGYRLCLLGDLAPSEFQEWESQLNSEATAINPQTPAPRVIHGGHLLDWAECFPGIIANLRNWPQGVFHWDAWAANCRAVTRHMFRIATGRIFAGRFSNTSNLTSPVWEGILVCLSAVQRASAKRALFLRALLNFPSLPL